MASITEIAGKFFEACETGKGWEGCKQYCKPGATFSAQAEPLADISDPAAVHRVDEGAADADSRRPL